MRKLELHFNHSDLMELMNDPTRKTWYSEAALESDSEHSHRLTMVDPEYLSSLEAKLKVAVELVRKGFKFSGHFDDCEQEHDDEPCTCGADEFEHQAHIFLSENDEIKAK